MRRRVTAAPIASRASRPARALRRSRRAAGSRAGSRLLVGRLDVGPRAPAAVPQLDPAPAQRRARRRPPRCRRARCRGSSRPRPRPSRSAARPRRGTPRAAPRPSGTTPSAASTDGSSTATIGAVAVGRGVEPVRAEEHGRGRRRTPARGSTPSETVRPPASTTAMRLGGGQPPRPGPGDLLERRRDRLDGAEVGAGADDDLRRRRRRSRRTASPRCAHRLRRQHRVRHVVGADQDHRDVAARSAAPVDLAGEVGGLGADHGERAQVDPPVGPLGHAGGEQRARGLLTGSTPYPAALESPSSAILIAGPGPAAAVPARSRPGGSPSSRPMLAGPARPRPAARRTGEPPSTRQAAAAVRGR